MKRSFILGILSTSFAITNACEQTNDNVVATKKQLRQANEQVLLHKAIENDSAQEIKQIVGTTAIKNKDEESSAEWFLVKAILNNRASDIKQAVHTLLTEGKNGNSAIVWSALLKKPNAVKTLLECGATIDSNIIKYAIKVGDFKSALIMVRHGIDISDIIQECMDCCIFYGRNNQNFDLVIEFAQELINRGYDINNVLYNDATYVYYNGKLLEFFLQRGANPDHIMEKNGLHGATPLMIAVHQRNKQAIEILLNAGANINKVAKFRRNYAEPVTPLFAAVSYNVVDNTIVELLLARGAQY